MTPDQETIVRETLRDAATRYERSIFGNRTALGLVPILPGMEHLSPDAVFRNMPSEQAELFRQEMRDEIDEFKTRIAALEEAISQLPDWTHGCGRYAAMREHP